MKAKHLITRKAVAVLAPLLVLVSACGGGNSASTDSKDELKPVRLTISTKNASFSFAILGAVAQGAGFFKEEGLNVKIETIDGSTAAVQSLGAGQSDIVPVEPPVVMAANQKGDTDAKFFYTLTTGFNLYPVVPVDSDIVSYGDLAGRKVAVPTLASGVIPGIKALAAADGADPASIEFLPVQAGAPMVQAMKSGKVDALGYWDTIYASLPDQGLQVRRVKAEQSNEPAFTLAYAATSDWLKKNPETAEAFGRASAKAYAFIEANPEAAARITMKLYPQLRSTGSEEEAVANGVREIKARLENCQPVEGKIGNSTATQVQDAIDLQVKQGVVQAGFSPDDVWTDEFIDAINEFDRQKVEEFARGYK